MFGPGLARIARRPRGFAGAARCAAIARNVRPAARTRTHIGTRMKNPLAHLHGSRSVPAAPSFLVGREAECARLRQAILRRESLLILGAPGSGKTALVASTIAGLNGDLQSRCLYLSAFKGLQDFLRRVVERLHEAGDAILAGQLRSESVRRDKFKNWLGAQPSSRLKGALYRSADNTEYWVFLDRVTALTVAEGKVVRELARMRGTPVYFIAREYGGRATGLLSDLYWNPASRLWLGALSQRAARELLEYAIREHGLERFDLRDFRAEVLHLSGGLPGAILQMCGLATDPRYRYGNHIKTSLVYIDFRMAVASVKSVPRRPIATDHGMVPDVPR